jgi:glycosyltransferase involved in cell wall biosynthesis
VISIVIPCFNARRWIGETLISALQPCEHEVEILVIDDGSTDGSAELTRDSFPEVRVVTTPNRGVSHARNLGIELARGDWFVFLDADDVLVQGKLDRQMTLAQAHSADVVYGNWQRLSPDARGVYCPAETVKRSLSQTPELDLFGHFWCPTGAYLFSRSIVKRVGGFNPRLPVIQDARFALDCALLGVAFVYDAEISCLYRTHASGSVSTTNRVAFLRDCLDNALDVAAIWSESGGMSRVRREVLLKALYHVAVGSCGLDDACFTEASAALDRFVGPGSVPGRFPIPQIARIVGSRRALQFATRIRRGQTYRWLKATGILSCLFQRNLATSSK